MLIRDFLASQAPRGGELVWIGSALPAHPAFEGMSVAGDEKAGPVGVLSLRGDDVPGLLARLGQYRGGERLVLFAGLLLPEPAVQQLAAALAEHGFQLLHAVYIDDAASIGVICGLSAQRTTAHDGDLVTANLQIIRSADGAGTDWSDVRAAFAKLARAHEQSVSEVAAAHAELNKAESRIHAIQSSTTMQVGRALVAIAQNPLRGTARSAGRLRAAWRSHRQDQHRAQVPDARHAVQGTASRLDFWAPLPIRPGSAPQSHASRLHVDVPAKHVVARMLKRDGVGGYEPTMMSWFLALCDTAAPGAVWDVGANLGLYGLLARAYSDREVIGFEPTPDLAASGRHLARINDLAYPLEQLAAADSAGTETFYIADDTDSSNSLFAGFRTSSRHMDVLVEPLDRYARRTGSVPAVVKVDTEATEHIVLRGAEQVVRTHRPWIFCEVLAGRPPEKHLTTMMKALDYRFFHLDGSDPLTETQSVVGDPTYAHMNYLFAPSELDERTVKAARAWAEALAATPRPAH